MSGVDECSDDQFPLEGYEPDEKAYQKHARQTIKSTRSIIQYKYLNILVC